MRLRRPHQLILPALALLVASGCNARGGGAEAVFSTTAAESLSATAIEGQAMVPASLISNNGSSLISNNGGGIIANNGGGIIAGNSSRYSLFGLNDAPLSNALAYLTDPSEQFYKLNGKMITTTTNKDGKYRFSQGVPKKKPVVVNVILSENRRVVGFTVPGAGSTQLDISIATTYVTEFLRQVALEAGETMADFDLKQLPALAATTSTAIDAGSLAVPDLNIGKIKDMDNQYAIAVGTNVNGLGDAWAKLLGFRTIAGTVVAGSGVTDNGGDGKPAVEGEFYRLKGVCQDKLGNIYLADEGNHKIRKIDAKTGLLSTFAGNGTRGYLNGPGDKAEFNFPRSVTIGPDGNLYVFDSQNARVRKVDINTREVTCFAGDGAKDLGDLKFDNGWGGDGGPAKDAKLFSVRGGAFDSAGNLYIVDGLKGTNYHTIRKVDRNGIISTFAGVPNSPGGFSGDGGPAAKAKFNYQNQIWITPDDQMYVADTFNDCIRKIDLKTTTVSTVAGVPGSRAEAPEADGKPALQAKLNQPYGVCVDKKGQLFISERGFHRVWVVKNDGKMYALAGGGTFTGEGDAKQLSFSEPHDLWPEADGNLLMAESRGVRLRRFWTKFGLVNNSLRYEHLLAG